MPNNLFGEKQADPTVESKEEQKALFPEQLESETEKSETNPGEAVWWNPETGRSETREVKELF